MRLQRLLLGCLAALLMWQVECKPAASERGKDSPHLACCISLCISMDVFRIFLVYHKLVNKDLFIYSQLTATFSCFHHLQLSVSFKCSVTITV